jgi:hypothetical protein
MEPSSEVAIEAFTTVLDVVSEHPETEAVFKEYDKKAGECICCQALFCSLEETARRYGLDLESFIRDLRAAALQTLE